MPAAPSYPARDFHLGAPIFFSHSVIVVCGDEATPIVRGQARVATFTVVHPHAERPSAWGMGLPPLANGLSAVGVQFLAGASMSITGTSTLMFLASNGNPSTGKPFHARMVARIFCFFFAGPSGSPLTRYSLHHGSVSAGATAGAAARHRRAPLPRRQVSCSLALALSPAVC